MVADEGISQHFALAARTEAPKQQMNRLEMAYADRLETLKSAKEIIHYEYEPLTLRLSQHNQRLGYTPDFIVINKEGQIEAHEVKGFWREAAVQRLKKASEQFWWIRFKSAERPRVKDPWTIREWPKAWAEVAV